MYKAMNLYCSSLRGLAQLVAYLNGVQVVAGSSPVAPILKQKPLHYKSNGFLLFIIPLSFALKKGEEHL